MNSRKKVVVYLLIGVIILLEAIKLYLAQQFSTTYQSHYEEIINQLEKVQQENMLLREQVLHDGAYQTISQEAKEQGFIPRTGE